VALVNEILVPRYNGLLQALLGMKGPDPAPQLAPDIQSNIILENDRPEQFLLQETWLLAGDVISTASVGNFSIVGLRNQTGTGKIAVITLLLALSNLRGGLRIASALAQTTTGGTSRDSRISSGPAMFFVNDNTTAVNGPQTYLLPQNVPVYQPIILTPGFEFVCSPTANNTVAELGIWWYERPIEGSEAQR
jgi:hypothetical protein